MKADYLFAAPSCPKRVQTEEEAILQAGFLRGLRPSGKGVENDEI